MYHHSDEEPMHSLQEGEVGLSASDARRLRDVCERVGCMATERPKVSFSTKHLEQDLGKLLKVCMWFS